MAQPSHTYSVTAPGFMGLNLQDSPVDMDAKFALEANNCIIDKYGRVGSREGWTKANTTAAALGTSDIKAIGELVSSAGVRTIVAAGNNKLFKLVGTTLTELTYGGGGVAPVITANNWQICALGNAVLFFQVGYDPLMYDIDVSTTTYRRISEHASYTGTIQLSNCAISAYGRIWNAGTSSNKNTLQWSDTLTYQLWTGGSAGTLNLLGVWPQGGDEIVAIAAHNNNLVLFGSKQVLVYAGANDPATMTLSDAISNSGCVGRDTVQETPDDLIFLSSGGLRSLKRTIQEKSAPLTVLSRTVNDNIISQIINESDGALIKSVYSPVDSFYLLTFTASLITYCFDLRSTMPDGALRVTTWTDTVPKCYYYTPDRKLYFGQAGYIARYGGFLDDTIQYRMSYYTSWIDFGDIIRDSILKKICATLYGGDAQVVTFKWGVDYESRSRSEQTTISTGVNPFEYGLAEYGIAEYSTGLMIDTICVNGGGVGKVIQAGIECEINGYQVSLQRFDVYTKDGAYK